MELGSSSPLNFTITTLLVFSIFLIIKKWKNSSNIISSSANLPPGPKKLPIIGNLHLISTLPFRSFRDLSLKYGPIMHLKLGEVLTIVVSSPEITKEMLKEYDPNYADRPATISMKIMWYDCLDIAFCQYNEYWKQMRKICMTEFLSAKNVRSFGTIRSDEVSRLIKAVRLSCGEPINLTDKISSMMSSITCRVAFGKVCKDSDAFMKLMKKALEMAGGFEIADLFPSSKVINTLSWGRVRLMMMRRKLDVILDDIIDEHRRSRDKIMVGGGDLARRGNGEFGNEDLVDVLLRIDETGELEFRINDDNIKAIIHDIFAAGTETSSTIIEWTIAELIRNPRVMAKAQAEVREAFKGTKIIQKHDIQKLKYLKLVIMEALRLHPPAPLLPRASREERKINGYTIPAKVNVLVNTWAMQRDPKYWTNPECFEPERFENQSVNFLGGDFQYLPFGAGKRMCPGMTFGLATIEPPLAQLLYSFNWKLPNGIKAEELNMIETHGITATRKDHLLVTATPYESLD